MNTLNINNNVSFGMILKTYKKPNGVKSADALDFLEELAFYKKIDKRLKRDVFEKTELGLKSKNMTIEKDNYLPKSNALRITDKTGSYYITDSKENNLKTGSEYNKMRQTFDTLIK